MLPLTKTKNGIKKKSRGGGVLTPWAGYRLWDLPPPNFGIFTAPHFCNISEPLPKMGTCNIEIVPETLDN